MESREAFDEAIVLFEEAIAQYKATKKEFDAIRTEIERLVQKGRSPPVAVLIDEKRVQVKLSCARARLVRYQQRIA